MKHIELLKLLEVNKDLSLKIILPSGEFVPEHFHITEVGRVQRTFIDCGGTLHETVSCLLQVWTANDVDHRLSAGKLADILALAYNVLELDDESMEIEYGVNVA